MLTYRLIARPWRVLLFALLGAVVLAALAAVAPGRLSAGGYIAHGTEAARADAQLQRHFGAGIPDLVLEVRAGQQVDEPHIASQGRALARSLARQQGVGQVFSYWTEGDQRLRSSDHRSGLVTADLSGDEATAVATAQRLVPELTGRHGDLTVAATGTSWASAQATEASRRDLLRAELIGAPLVVIVLLFAFGSLTAALLPALIGAVAVAGGFAALRLLAVFMPVSAFAGNLTAALGFGLAVDYGLFVVTRFREELAAGMAVPEAVARTMGTAGRAVLCSGATAIVCLSALLLFPLGLLRSLACAGMAVVAFATAATLLVLPAVLALLGTRIDRFSLPRHRRSPAQSGLWSRTAGVAVRRPVLAGGCAALFLLLLLVPFAHVRFGPTDERVLPAGLESHATAARVQETFDVPWNRTLRVVLPHTDPLMQQELVDSYARSLSATRGVARVEGFTGVFRHGERVAEPGSAAVLHAAPGATWIAVLGSGGPQRDEALVERVRALRPAPGIEHLVGGRPARALDTKHAVAGRLLPAAAIVVGCIALLLFWQTGSVVIPIKAVVVGALSLGASFGAMVFVFQDGHLAWLLGGFTVTGELETSVPVLMFCIAFALSVDYEVFLISRVLEEHRRGASTTEALVTGVASTSRVITVAALLVAVALAPLVTSEVTLLKLIGCGLALAVLVDATVVRGVLVPAFMRIAGRANWWCPAPLARWHRRLNPGAHRPLPAPEAEGEAVPGPRGSDAPTHPRIET
ncbi:MMPL family transporter [Streptomyces sp. NPDC059564]|uniref:MMPL family transporter n=1 Tax=Streptomyces sp. NPDC059564 TaxID=3346865 RepID=UPI0036A6A621